MALTDDAARLIGAVAQSPKAETAKTVRGRVVSVEGKTAWVAITGGFSRTPCDMSASCSVGDQVIVSLYGGRATVTSNLTSPATDDSVASAAYRQSDEAMEQAGQVYAISKAAQAAVSRAVSDAAAASVAASSASSAASSAQSSADRAQASADTAQDSADSAISYAATASANAASAASDAATALASANASVVSANTALNQLSEVEKVLGTLNWIAEHGSYEPSGDSQVDDSKVYYERTGSGTAEDPYAYAPVADPQDEDVAGYYVLVVDESVQNYIASHLAMTDYGLNLMFDGTNDRVHIGTVDGTRPKGVYLIADGAVQSAYSADGATVGPADGFHVSISSRELGFYQGATRVAYVSNNELYIPNTVVLNSMRLGDWSFVRRDNGNMGVFWVGE